jgi:alkaline phosphatase
LGWTTGGHTVIDVPLYAYGPGAEHFTGTMDNTDIGKRIADLLGIEPFPVKKTNQQAGIRGFKKKGGRYNCPPFRLGVI